MQPTIYGLIIVLGGLLLMRKPPAYMLGFVIVSMLLAAASAIDLPALGGSSILPSRLALLMLALRICFSPLFRFDLIWAALRENAWLVLFAVYTAATAMILPHLFAGEMTVGVMRENVGGLLEKRAPLHFTPQNITTSVYLLGTLFMALAASLVARQRKAGETITTAIFILAWLHVGLGLADLALSFVNMERLFSVFRNAGYAQLDQSVAGFRRISGTFSETSGYAHFGYVIFVFVAELWLRGVRPRQSGAVAAALLLMLLLTTSSTAYLGLTTYALIIAVRFALIPGGTTNTRTLVVLICGAGAVTGALAIAVFNPDLSERMVGVLQAMTVNKQNSASGLQRAMWMRQGIEAFRISHGLGIGAGSFRSSSLYAAILGSSGVIGMTMFSFYLVAVFKPLRRSNYVLRTTPTQALGAAAMWAAIGGIIPLMLTAPSPDPGMLFTLFAGLSLTWRGRELRAAEARSSLAARQAPAAQAPLAGAAGEVIAQ